MTAPRVWIIDEEWPDHSTETRILHDALPQVDIRESGYDWQADLESFGADADVIIAQVYANLPEALIGRLTHCRGVALCGGGYDRVDLDAANRSGIPVCNVHGYCTEDIASYVLQAVLHHLKPLDELDSTRHELSWGLPAIHLMPRLSSSTLHIVGLGAIGSATALLARAVGMQVTATDPHQSATSTGHHGVSMLPLDEGLRGADFVSLHCPLTASTEGLIGEPELALMKPTATIINTARGGLVDEAALAAALNSGRIAAAILDVLIDEPNHQGSPLLKAPHTLVTPHISYASADSLTELRSRTTHNALAMLDGQIPADCVNASQIHTLLDRPSSRPELGALR